MLHAAAPLLLHAQFADYCQAPEDIIQRGLHASSHYVRGRPDVSSSCLWVHVKGSQGFQKGHELLLAAKDISPKRLLDTWDRPVQLQLGLCTRGLLQK